jgi:hypothetical protein
VKVNPHIQELIDKRVLAENQEREPSGRLSASRLGWPLQWQMLWHYKIPQEANDAFTLRKFQRGHDVEERLMKWLAARPEDMQVPVTYRGIVGIADVILEYPVEVKSTTNRAFRYKQKDGPSRSHVLQGELYAKALGYTKFGVAYVASDDYRVLCFEEEVTGEVDAVIDVYERQVETGIVPLFEAKEQWQALAEYNPYPEWMDLNEEEIADKLLSMGIVTTKPLPGM